MIDLKKWETEIGSVLMESDCVSSSRYILDTSSNVSIWEAFLKVRSRWYLVPTVLHKMFPASDPLCWRCCKEYDNMIHVWWFCSMLKQFWIEVHAEITLITDIFLPFTPECLLLHFIWPKSKKLTN